MRRRGDSPAIEAALEQVGPDQRVPLLRELLYLEIVYRRQRGERPTVDEYRARFPEHGDLIATELSVPASPLDWATGPADINLLFGILALQLDMIDRDALVTAMNAWVLEKSTPLGEILVRQGVLTRHAHELLAPACTTQHIKQHGDAPEKSLAALGSVSSVHKLLQEISDSDVQASLAHTSQGHGPDIDPYKTIPSVSQAASSQQRFRVLRLHAKGGLGEVSVAEDVELHRESAHSDETTLAPVSGSGSTATRMGSVVGTPAFMSPEQASGDLDALGFRTDVYSLGATLYYLLTGRPPFGGPDVEETLRKVRQGESLPPRAVSPAVPRPLEAVCLRAMAVDRMKRYMTSKDLKDDIESWLADEPVSAWREPWRDRLIRWARRHRAWVQAGAASLLTVAVVSSVAVLVVDHARRNEALAREDAEASLREARRTVDNFYTRVSEEKLLDVPGLQPLRRQLLRDALKYYGGFLERHGDDPSLAGDLSVTLYGTGRMASNS